MRSLSTKPFRHDMAAGECPVERCLGGLALGAGLVAAFLLLVSWLSAGWGGAFDPAILMRVRAAVASMARPWHWPRGSPRSATT